MNNSRKQRQVEDQPHHDHRHTMETFEAQRRIELDTCHDKDQDYWLAFQHVIQRSQEANEQLKLFFESKVLVEERYCAALTTLGSILVPPEDLDLNDTNNPSIKMLTHIGKLPQTMVEKFQAFHTHQQRDSSLLKWNDMITRFQVETQTMIEQGSAIDRRYHEAHVRVREQYDDCHGEDPSWIDEYQYHSRVMVLKETRMEYVKTMASLFQQYKHLEKWRWSVIQSAMENQLDHEKMMFQEMAGIMQHANTHVVQRIHPDRQVNLHIQSIPENNTAKAWLDKENLFYATLPHPMSSLKIRKTGPLLWRPCSDVEPNTAASLLSYVTGQQSMTWKSVTGVVTQDHQFYVLETDHQRSDICQSLSLDQCTVHIQVEDHETTDHPIFELIETTTRGSEKNASMWSFISSQEHNVQSRSYRFQCPDQSAMMDWIFALEI